MPLCRAWCRETITTTVASQTTNVQCISPFTNPSATVCCHSGDTAVSSFKACQALFDLALKVKSWTQPSSASGTISVYV